MIDDADLTAFVFEQTPTACKKHKCSECSREINPGEKYTRTAIGIEGTVQTNKMCCHCKIAAQWLIKHCGGWCYGSIKEELTLHYDQQFREDNLQKLLIGINRKWKAFQGEGLLPCPPELAKKEESSKWN
jgi:hypothetical protein